jgi:hypothetical protein
VGVGYGIVPRDKKLWFTLNSNVNGKNASNIGWAQP